MGDIADMMLDGTLDEETGEYVGDINREKYGTESPGFPVRHFCKPSRPERVPCPTCGKKVAEGQGLRDHLRDKHGE